MGLGALKSIRNNVKLNKKLSEKIDNRLQVFVGLQMSTRYTESWGRRLFFRAFFSSWRNKGGEGQ